MAGKTHKVTILGKAMVEACERRFGSYCGICTAEEQEAALVTPSRGRPGPEFPFRPSAGTPAGWSEAVAEEV